MASVSSPLTKAPITPRLVTLRFSNDFDLLDVFKNGYKYNGICAILKYINIYLYIYIPDKNWLLVSWCNAIFYNKPNTLHTLLEAY